MRQLASDAAVPARVGRPLPRPRARRRRRPRARVRVRARSRQRPPRGATWASTTRWSSTTSSASGARSTTSTGRPSTSSIATGRSASTTSAKATTTGARRAIRVLARGGGSRRPLPPDLDYGQLRTASRLRRLGQPSVPGDVSRLRPDSELCVSRRFDAGSTASRLRRSGSLAPQSVGPPRGLGDRGGHAIVSNRPAGRLSFRFHSRDVHLVLRARPQGALTAVPGFGRRRAAGRGGGSMSTGPAHGPWHRALISWSASGRAVRADDRDQVRRAGASAYVLYVRLTPRQPQRKEEGNGILKAGVA